MVKSIEKNNQELYNKSAVEVIKMSTSILQVSVDNKITD